MSCGQPYEGNRRLEQRLTRALQQQLERTIPPSHARESYRSALANSIPLYQALFDTLPEELRNQIARVDRGFLGRSFTTLGSV